MVTMRSNGLGTCENLPHYRLRCRRKRYEREDVVGLELLKAERITQFDTTKDLHVQLGGGGNKIGLHDLFSCHCKEMAKKSIGYFVLFLIWTLLPRGGLDPPSSIQTFR